MQLGNHIWAFKVMELNKAHIVLSPLRLTKMRKKSELMEAFRRRNLKQISNYLYGTRIATPVQIGINLGSGVIDLVRIPIEQYQSGGNILVGLGAGASSLVQKISVELLNLGASSAITIKKGLRGLDRALSNEVGTTPPSPDSQHYSQYADQPRNLAQGARRAASSLRRGFRQASDTLSSGGVTTLPRAILHPAIGGLGAFSHLTLGLRNMLDQQAWESANEKYKAPPTNQ